MQNYLTKYIKNRKGQAIGCIYAKKSTSEDNTVYVTGSLCNIKEEPFDRSKAISIAEQRAVIMNEGSGRIYKLPYSLKYEIGYMANRAARYFKDCKIICAECKSPTERV
jgi:hypothetical protein